MEEKRKVKGKRRGMVSNILFCFAPAAKKTPVYLVHIGIQAVTYVLLLLMAVGANALVISMLREGSRLLLLVGAVMTVFLVYGLISWVDTYLYHMISVEYIEMRLGGHFYLVFEKILEIPLEQSESSRVRQLIEKSLLALNGSIFNGVEGLMRRFGMLCTNVLGLVTYALIMGSLDMRILMLLVGLSLITVAASKVSTKVYEKIKEKLAGYQRVEEYIDRLLDDIAGGKDIRVFGLSDWLIGKYDAAIRKRRKYRAFYNMACFFSDFTEVILAAVRDFICYFYLIYLLQHGLSSSMFVFYIGLISGFAKWFTEISSNFVVMKRCSNQVSDLREFLELDSGQGEANRIPENQFSSLDIAFDHVSYRYEGAEEEVLKDVSFTIRQGERLALVGLNGAGKSTIVKLISGLYLPTSGAVYVNGIDTRELDRNAYMHQVAAIFQNPFLMSYTVGENVALAEDWEEEKVWDALEKAGVAEKIRSLPQGLHTYLGKDVSEDGIMLSGGQIQKLLLARALYHRPKLLLLDEPTAALDALAEKNIYDTYRKTLEGTSTIFISHRLASTRFCDEILLLEKGEITERGTHEKLMELGGTYASLFRLQGKYYQEEEAYE
nr:ABC transporter ATP-binding protein [uncultured Faecalimonas sp.]